MGSHAFDESSYVEGKQRSLIDIMAYCAKKLGYGDLRAEGAMHIVERAQAVIALREICGEFGDNDWDNNIYLEEILRSHLLTHLRRRAEEAAAKERD